MSRRKFALLQGNTFFDGLCPPYMLTIRAGTGGRGPSEARRIRSHYLLPKQRKASRTLYTPPLQGRASLSTINDAITPRRDVLAEECPLP